MNWRYVRAAGRVQRCHTRTIHGSYSVAEHSYQCLVLLLAYHPNPSLTLIKRVMTHDSHELETGDVPAPAKWRSPALTLALVALESEIEKAAGLDFPGLSAEDLTWVKSIDILELALWGLEQWDLGNCSISDLLSACIKPLLANKTSELHGVVLETVKRIRLTIGDEP